MATKDMELKQAFEDLQKKIKYSSRMLKNVDDQISRAKTITLNTLNDQENVRKFDSRTTLYEAVGRCYVLSSKKMLDQVYDKHMEENQRNIKNLENHKSRMEKNLAESEAYLRDLIQQKKSSS